jgi:hypothetical protein
MVSLIQSWENQWRVGRLCEIEGFKEAIRVRIPACQGRQSKNRFYELEDRSVIPERMVDKALTRVWRNN